MKETNNGNESWGITGWLWRAQLIFLVWGFPVVYSNYDTKLNFYLLLFFAPIVTLNGAKQNQKISMLFLVISAFSAYLMAPVITFMIAYLVAIVWFIGWFLIGIAKNHP